MTPDELRALADALPEGVHWSDPITPDMLAEAIKRFCADAQPVPAGWKPVPVEPTPEMLSAVGMMDGYDWHAPGCSPDADHANWYSAMIAAAPAVPQAEPIADSDADYWLRNRQAILDAIERAGFMLMSNASGFWLHPRGKTDAQAAVCELKRELAMAKREPLHELPPLPEPGAYAYEWRLQTGSVYRSFSARHYNGVPCDDQVLFFTADQMREYARRAVDIALERAAQECHAQKGGLSSEWGDGHDTGCDDCFAAIRALGKQHD